MPGLLRNPPLALYVHMPWCVRKCPYCDFNSHALTGELPAEEYVRALIADLEADLPLVWGRPVQSIYFGGGTPSLFPAATVGRFLSEVRARLELYPGAEITLEANPGTVEHDSFSAYAEAGVNRVSLGVQSFDDHALERLGRIHRVRETEGSLAALARSGIANFNIDLMYGLPGQSVAAAMHDLQMAIGAGPAHISWYQLTLEPNTAFAAEPPELPAEEDAWEMQQLGMEMLQAAGFDQYEVSAYAMPGRQCAHNVNYWVYGDFLAVGAGAHGKITAPAEDSVYRFAKHRHPKRYLQGLQDGSWLAERRRLDGADLAFEFFLNHLRLKQGFLEDDFPARTGLPWDVVEQRVQQAVERGLLEVSGGRGRPTAHGWNFVNDIQQMFLP